ncbi:MAG: polymerase delta subunit, partial [Deltaproteobacteria bacterium]|nr:polymerase delta subunit [Deltaproteobacteria bacterium]
MVARALATGLHCDTAPFDACGTCNACRTIAAGTHPDVR